MQVVVTRRVDKLWVFVKYAGSGIAAEDVAVGCRNCGLAAGDIHRFAAGIVVQNVIGECRRTVIHIQAAAGAVGSIIRKCIIVQRQRRSRIANSAAILKRGVSNKQAIG